MSNEPKENKMKIFRHGDVLLKQIEITKEVKEALAKSEPQKECTIALGEATGHHHTLYPGGDEPSVRMVEIEGRRFLDVGTEYFLRHQEHHELRIDPGCYEIIMEEEYCPFEKAMKKVMD